MIRSRTHFLFKGSKHSCVNMNSTVTNSRLSDSGNEAVFGIGFEECNTGDDLGWGV